MNDHVETVSLETIRATAVSNQFHEESKKLSQYRTVLWVSAVSIGLLQTLAYRQSITPDGISYLDIARRVSEGSWQALINAYWSPLYPFLLGIVFRVLRPSPEHEILVAHFVNFGIFMASFCAFEFLLRTILSSQRSRSNHNNEFISEEGIWGLGGTLFIWSTVLFIGVQSVLPDLMMSAFVYLAAALLLRLQAMPGAFGTSIALGLVLGFSYLAKAVMFPLAFAFLACLVLQRKPLSKTALPTFMALCAFLLVSLPFVRAVSTSKGRWTTGDVGRIAYAEFVNGAPRYIHWQGQPPSLGSPAHATRALLTNPAVFEFSEPIQGSYPPWYDPSYWYDGIKPRFRLNDQLRALRYTTEEYIGIVKYMGGLLAGFLGMVFLARREGPSWFDISGSWCLLLPALAALALYYLVYVEARFVAGFFVLAWLGLFASLRYSSTARAQAGSLALAVILTLACGLLWPTWRSLYRATHPEPSPDLRVAEFLRGKGIEPGSPVASIGDGINSYWAHVASVKIIAEVPFAQTMEFFTATEKGQSEVLSLFARLNARAVVIDRRPPSNPFISWQQISGTDYFYCLLTQAPSVGRIIPR